MQMPVGGTGGVARLMTVVVPARNAASMLRTTLEALKASDLAPDAWELVVVDDASDDATALVASEFADRVVRLAGRAHGPAYARNRGVQGSNSTLLAFIDADVVVHESTLRMLARSFDVPDVGAVFGSYDEKPAAPGLVSQYRNLMHHYVHAANAGGAETFWAGCGAVRRDVFERVGGFDERRYPTPQIEDIELGHRIRDLGVTILLRPDIQCTHLKRWTLRSMVTADLMHRGVPWVELLLEEGSGARSSTLNVRPAEKLYTVLVVVAGGMAVTAIALRDTRWLIVSAALLVVVVMGNLALLRWYWGRHGAKLAMVAIPLRLLHYAISAVSVVWGGLRHLTRRSADERTTVPRSPIAFSGDTPQLG